MYKTITLELKVQREYPQGTNEITVRDVLSNLVMEIRVNKKETFINKGKIY